MSAGSSGSPVTDFTSLDYAGVQPDIVLFAQARFPEEQWTDFNDSNFGTHLIELMAYATDLLSYNANSQVMEAIVVLLVREKNFRNIGTSLDYTMKSATPSATTLEFVINPAGPFPFVLSSHLQIATTDGSVVFQPTADTAVAALPPGGVIDIDAVNGKEFYQEVLGVSTGQPGQSFQLRNPNVIDGTDSVTVGAAGYARISNAVEAGPTDKTYLITTDENGFSTITFGDGFFGAIPPKGQTCFCTYKTGGGTNTNLPASNPTQTVVGNIIGTSDGSPVPAAIVSVSNVTSATGGGPKQSLANAKQNLPLSLKANDRAVTEQDYATLAVALVPGVFKAQAISGAPINGGVPILLFVVPDGGGFPSNALKNLCVILLKQKKMAGKRIRVMNPVYVSLQIEIDMFVQGTSVAALVASRGRNLIENTEFNEDALDFGAEYDLQTTLYQPLQPSSVQGLDHIFVKTFTVKPYWATHVNSPTTGNGSVEGITIIEGLVQRREWLIEVIGPNVPGGVFCNQFQVLQRQLGTVTSVDDSLVVDESADYVSDSLTGWLFHPNPEQNDTTFAILGNTAQTITTASGLLVFTEADDPYVVELQASVTGKILKSTLAGAAGTYLAHTSVHVDSSQSWHVGDKVYVTNGAVILKTSVFLIPDGTHLEFADDLPNLGVGTTFEFFWESDDGSVGFVVRDGTTAFVVGDEVYVDTYPQTGDIRLRAENFPQLADADVTINTIGGT